MVLFQCTEGTAGLSMLGAGGISNVMPAHLRLSGRSWRSLAAGVSKLQCCAGDLWEAKHTLWSPSQHFHSRINPQQTEG